MYTVINRVDEFNVAAPGANTNILSANVTPLMAGYWTVYVVLATASVFNVTEAQGATTFTIGLNTSASLNAGDGYAWSFPVATDSAYNFQVETNGVIRRLVVIESYMGV